METTSIPFINRSKYRVVLVALKDHPKRLYHYCKTGAEEYSWAVRDYLTGQIIRSGDSKMTASQIEEEWVEYAEQPPSCPEKRVDFWRDHCQGSSERHFGTRHADSTSPNPPTLGAWKRMSGGHELL